MSTSRRIVGLLGGAAAALLTSFIMPMALGHADVTFPPGDGGPYETCDGGICLVMGDATQADWQYSGLRPFFTDWQTDDQPYHVVDQDGSVLGTYDMYVQDMWSPYIAVSHYEYGDFTPNPDAAGDPDLGAFGDLSGAVIYDTSYTYNGVPIDLLTLNDVVVHGHEMSFIVYSYGDVTSVMAHTATDSAAYYQIGDADPIFMWDSLFHSAAPEIPDYLIPADPFAVIDFEPCDFGMCDLAGL